MFRQKCTGLSVHQFTLRQRDCQWKLTGVAVSVKLSDVGQIEAQGVIHHPSYMHCQKAQDDGNV